MGTNLLLPFVISVNEQEVSLLTPLYGLGWVVSVVGQPLLELRVVTTWQSLKSEFPCLMWVTVSFEIIWPAGSCSQAVLLTLSSCFPLSFIAHDLGTV